MGLSGQLNGLLALWYGGFRCLISSSLLNLVSGQSGERLSKNRSLRHIHVALLLRHPWLRKFLESRSPDWPILTAQGPCHLYRVIAVDELVLYSEFPC